MSQCWSVQCLLHWCYFVNVGLILSLVCCDFVKWRVYHDRSTNKNVLLHKHTKTWNKTVSWKPVDHCHSVQSFSNYAVLILSFVLVILQQEQQQQQQQQLFYVPLSGTTRVSWCQKKHSPTHHPDHHPVFISFFHLPQPIASSLFKLHAWQSFCTTSLHILFGLPLGLEPARNQAKKLINLRSVLQLKRMAL